MSNKPTFEGKKCDKLIEQISGIDGVETVEAYQFNPDLKEYAVLIKTSNGHMIEGNLKRKEDFASLFDYITAVNALGPDFYLKNYPESFVKDVVDTFGLVSEDEANALEKIRN